MRAQRFMAVSCAGVVALGAAACGSDKKKSSTTAATPGASTTATGGTGGTIDIYSSLPLKGASKEQTAPMVNGIKLALKQAGNKAGQFTVKYQSLDDSTAQAGKWDSGQTAQDARTAAQDAKAVYYIGEFNSGASQVSIPILNAVGLAQVSPANTYPGLTTNEPGTVAGEPDKYYTASGGKRSYLRIVPRDTIQAAALLTTMKADGCKHVAVANDKDTYGAGLGKLLLFEAPKIGVDVIGMPASTRTRRTSAPTRPRSRARRTASPSPGSPPTEPSRSPRTSPRRSRM